MAAPPDAARTVTYRPPPPPGRPSQPKTPPPDHVGSKQASSSGPTAVVAKTTPPRTSAVAVPAMPTLSGRPPPRPETAPPPARVPGSKMAPTTSTGARPASTPLDAPEADDEDLSGDVNVVVPARMVSPRVADAAEAAAQEPLDDDAPPPEPQRKVSPLRKAPKPPSGGERSPAGVDDDSGEVVGDSAEELAGDGDVEAAGVGEDEGEDDGDTPPMRRARSKRETMELVRELERELKREHLRQMIVMEERLQQVVAEKNAKIEMLEDLLMTKDAKPSSRGASRSQLEASGSLSGAASVLLGGAAGKDDAFALDECVGYGLPETPVLGATHASSGAVLSGTASVQTLGTVTELERCFRNPSQVRAFFREHFAWGPLDQPLRAGKRAYNELLEAFTVSQLSAVHLHMRVVSVARATVVAGSAQLAPSHLDSLEALKNVGKPGDFDLFVLDCGGNTVASSVVGGGALFLITYPGTEAMLPWHLARVGQRRFREMVASSTPKEKMASNGSAEERMLKAPVAVLQGALAVLLKMHLNLNAYPGQSKYTAVPVRSKVFGRVAAVEGAAEFLVEHGWVDDGGPKILFQGNAPDVDRAIAALERMNDVVAKRKERVCPGSVLIDGGSYHGSSFSWDEWRASEAPLYLSWMTSINHRSLMATLSVDWTPLFHFVPPDHPLRSRLRASVSKQLVCPPPVTDLVWACMDTANDLVLSLPANFIPILRYLLPQGHPAPDTDSVATFPEPPRSQGHRPFMVLCYRAGSTATRLPVTSVSMSGAPTKGEEPVKCSCGLGVPSFGGYSMVVTRRRGDRPVLGIAVTRVMRTEEPAGFEPVCSDDSEEAFNFHGDALDGQHVRVRYAKSAP